MTIESLYVHIPFCNHICGYCDFTRFRYDKDLSDRFIDRLVKQIQEIPNSLKTIYVGGGTPTSLDENQLTRVLEALKPLLKEKTEFTFEANPENITREKIELLYKFGVNRISLGVQTSDDTLLKDIGRHHKFYDVKEAVYEIRDVGINNISLDLMYGLPNQTLESLIQSIEDVLSLKPDHVSIYALILEPNSIFGKKGIKPIDIDLETDMYLACIEQMTQHGYEHYEISNFALNGKRSEHNQVYWRYDDFYALGPGSSLKVNHVRKTWTRSLKTYMEKDEFVEIINLSKQDEMFEFVMMGLRLKEGISFKRFYDRFNIDLRDVFKKAIHTTIENGLLYINEERIFASDLGFVMLDDILIEFLNEFDLF